MSIKFIKLKSSDLRNITLFLIDNKIIFHPIISPNGAPDFTGYEGRKFILILDRNILVTILRLVTTGVLKDAHSLKIVSSLLLWAEYNQITITSGLALSEYSYFNKESGKASLEHNIFLEIFKQCNPGHWLELALSRRESIPPITIKNKSEYQFFIEDDHFKMHYLEMLKISQLFFSEEITLISKFKTLHHWIYENILICKYTTYFAAMVFGGKSKIFRRQKPNFDEILKKCTSQAWDLTYLSFWSTQYYHEQESNHVYLFATMDKELKELFILTHKESLDIYIETFGMEDGKKIINILNRTYSTRPKPEIDPLILDRMIFQEKENLKRVLK